MKMLIINNLASGYHDGAIYDFIRSVTRSGDETTIRSFSHISEVNQSLHDLKDYDIVVAAGGDATISAVSYALRNSNTPILTFPAGTANLISLNLLLPTEPHALAKLVHSGKKMQFDCGEVADSKNKRGFGVMANIGFSNYVSKNAKPGKHQFGPFAYIASALSNVNPPFHNFEITTENGTIQTSGIGIMVMNFSKIGLDLSVTHSNLPRDGKLDIVVLKAKKPLGYLPALTAATIDKAINFPDRSDAIEIHTSNWAKIDCNEKLEVFVDETNTNITTPFEVRALASATTYIVNDEGFEFYK